MRTIQVQQKGTGYEAVQFWFKNGKVTGIAEWYEIPCEHEHATYSVDIHNDELTVDCVCDLSNEDIRTLLDQFDWESYFNDCDQIKGELENTND